MLPGSPRRAPPLILGVHQRQRLGRPSHVALERVHQPLVFDERLKQSEPAERTERQSERTGRGRPGKLTACPGQGDDLGESGIVVGECRNGDGPDPVLLPSRSAAADDRPDTGTDTTSRADARRYARGAR